ncbi:hypothetical protein G7Y89_g6117 [Cudoniella acicularis]|uniref:Uncharacterized protein n=1 Tax=Cudoniella acicularis TaxID=354080 RepID=A0A8H4RMJ3_9HELO|nr:hypothetical protein G7Y89_g6117 [Cudoniella acicularis]
MGSLSALSPSATIVFNILTDPLILRLVFLKTTLLKWTSPMANFSVSLLRRSAPSLFETIFDPTLLGLVWLNRTRLLNWASFIVRFLDNLGISRFWQTCLLFFIARLMFNLYFDWTRGLLAQKIGREDVLRQLQMPSPAEGYEKIRRLCARESSFMGWVADFDFPEEKSSEDEDDPTPNSGYETRIQNSKNNSSGGSDADCSSSEHPYRDYDSSNKDSDIESSHSEYRDNHSAVDSFSDFENDVSDDIEGLADESSEGDSEFSSDWSSDFESRVRDGIQGFGEFSSEGEDTPPSEISYDNMLEKSGGDELVDGFDSEYSSTENLGNFHKADPNPELENDLIKKLNDDEKFSAMTRESFASYWILIQESFFSGRVQLDAFCKDIWVALEFSVLDVWDLANGFFNDLSDTVVHDLTSDLEHRDGTTIMLLRYKNKFSTTDSPSLQNWALSSVEHRLVSHVAVILEAGLLHVCSALN